MAISTESADKLSLVLSALAHPVRRQMLMHLKLTDENELSVNDLAEPLDISLPAVSNHLRVLEKAGLISREKKAQTRISHLEVEPLQILDDWLETYRQLLDEKYERLENYLKKLKRKD